MTGYVVCEGFQAVQKFVQDLEADRRAAGKIDSSIG